MKNKRTPDIRFAGFTGDWEHCNLGDISTKIGSGKTPKGGSQNYKSEGIPLLRSQNIFNDKVNFNDVVYITPEIDEDMANSRVQKDDVLLNITGASIGRSAVYKLNHKANVNQHVSIIRPSSKVNPYFIQLNIASEKGQKQIELNQAGGGREGLNFQQIAKMGFYFPDLLEQGEIGDFFIKLDNTIALYQQELTILNQTKQGFLQKMFPKEGKSVPEVRFPGFTGEWELRKIREIGDLSAGGDINKSKLVDNEKYPVLANALTNDGIIGYYNEYKIEAPAVTITGRGDVGHAKARHINFTPVVRLLVLKADGFDVDFLENCINTRNIFVESTGVPQLTVPQLGTYEISFPSFREQTKIGRFFKQLDDTISLHQSEIEALQKMKKAFLQKMFV